VERDGAFWRAAGEGARVRGDGVCVQYGGVCERENERERRTTDEMCGLEKRLAD